eukprot:4037923-Pyramimonas_sp.AAC.1
MISPFDGLRPAEDRLREGAVAEVELVVGARQLEVLHQLLMLLDSPLLHLEAGRRLEHQVVVRRGVAPPQEVETP